MATHIVQHVFHEHIHNFTVKNIPLGIAPGVVDRYVGKKLVESAAAWVVWRIDADRKQWFIGHFEGKRTTARPQRFFAHKHWESTEFLKTTNDLSVVLKIVLELTFENVFLDTNVEFVPYAAPPED